MVNEGLRKLSLRKNDQVQVMVGREKKKTGKVLKVDDKSGRVTVEKVNMVKRHMRPNQKYPHGGIIEKEASLAYSSVLLFCKKCNRGVRHGVKFMEKPTKKGQADGSSKVKVRFCRKCDEVIDSV
ncbi:MAG: 50S ribosomal protein L24 [Bdellovibrionota bacterium]